LDRIDVEAAAGVLYDAFGAVYRQRGHAPPFPTRDSAAWLCRAYLDLDPEGCAIAWDATQAVGVGFAHPRGAVTSIGPLAARPGAPPGVARALMAELGRVAAQSGSLRLFQDSFNPDSFGLYARLGYMVADVAPYLLAEKMTPPVAPVAGVRAMRPDDIPTLERYDRARTAADRRRDLALLASTGSALVALGAGGAMSGYLFYRPLPARVVIGPGVAESGETMGDLVDGVAATLPGRAAVIRGSAAAPSVLLRAFARGFRVDHLGNLMVAGPYTPPPAQLYALFPESL
ncbi:MAG TPA: hypothetical protein VGP64_16385, partial [Polyangia bacterium]